MDIDYLLFNDIENKVVIDYQISIPELCEAVVGWDAAKMWITGQKL
jgi:hypothetical protein